MIYLCSAIGIVYAIVCSFLLYGRFHINMIWNIVLCIMGAVTGYMNISKSINALIMLIGLAILLFESMSDIHSKQTYTYPIYIAVAIIIVLRIIQACTCGAGIGYIISVILLIICAVIICFALSNVTAPFLGGGDIDVLLLCLLACPLYGSIWVLAIAFRWLARVFSQKIARNGLQNIDVCMSDEDMSSISKQKIYNKTVPVVPFITVGYCLFLFF